MSEFRQRQAFDKRKRLPLWEFAHGNQPRTNKHKTMKSVVQFKEMSANDRSKNLKSRATKAARDELKKEISKIIVAAEESGDFGKGEMNSWSLKITGIELRRELQGTYEYANVLRGIRSGDLPFAEKEFDKAPSFGLIKLAGFMGKNDPEKVAECLEIIRSGKDLTNRLKAMTAKPKDKDESKSKDKPESNGDESGSLNSGTPEAPPAESPKGDSYFVPEGTSILNVPEIQARILEDLRKTPDIASCENLHEFLKGLVGHLHSRWEVLEAEAAKAESKELVAA